MAVAKAVAVDNHEAYETISWIMDNADSGFFIVTAPHNMQRGLAELYETSKVKIYDYAQNASPYSYSKLNSWAESNMEADFFFVLNMQLALRNENDMLSFNLCRDMLSKKNKAWLFFMTKDLEYRLSTFAFDFYSYVRLKAHFLPEKDVESSNQIIIGLTKPVNIVKAREALARYKDLEEKLVSLPLDGTPDNQLITAATTLTNIAELYINCTEYDNALRFLELVKEIREKIRGKWHPDTAATYNDIATACFDQGEYTKSLEWLGRVLAIRENALGKEHPDTASTYNNIAAVYYGQGDYAKALEWFGKALAIRENALGKDHPDTATTYNNIGVVYSYMGKYTTALEWFGKALAVRENALGKDHPDTAEMYNNIAVVYSHMGEYTKASEWLWKALAIRENALGKDHPDIAETYNNIAAVYYDQGDYANALEWSRKALAAYEKSLGKEHPSTIGAKRALEHIQTLLPRNDEFE